MATVSTVLRITLFDSHFYSQFYDGVVFDVAVSMIVVRRV